LTGKDRNLRCLTLLGLRRIEISLTERNGRRSVREIILNSFRTVERKRKFSIPYHKRAVGDTGPLIISIAAVVVTAALLAPTPYAKKGIFEKKTLHISKSGYIQTLCVSIYLP
jgi:hypothetical protein